ncbi:MAG TPA: DUF3738 domain-containing protein, partial [Vicinamibacterales bacterium]|nr:DUF3738 domain-containing protein [Vicinamibacterales bacterium]
ATALMLAAPAVLAQAAFDVASIKESKSLEAGGSMRFFPDGGVRADNMPARALITIAYELKFALVRVQRDRLGPQLRVSELDCQAASAGPRCRQGRIGTEQIALIGNPMTMLLQVVVNKVTAPVSDETGLTGRYDIDMQWSNEVAPGDDRPSIYTAFRSNWG